MIDAIKDAENIYKKFFMDILKDYNKKQFVDDFENLSFENIKEKMSYLVNNLAKELYDDYYLIYKHELEKCTSDFNEIYDPLIYLERDKALTEHIKNTYENEVNLKEYYKFNSNKNEYFTIFQDIKKNEKEFYFNTIYPNFRMGIRDFTDTKIVLNLSLSKNEIIDYIEKIKYDYDKKNSIIKTPKQLLEEELERYNYVVDIVNTEIWADVLFIYDYYRICELYTDKKDYRIIEEIQIELTKYHGLKIKKSENEIKKNKKKPTYKQVSWKEYLKNNPDTDEKNIYFKKDEKPYLSTKTIKYKYKLIKEYIEGDNPKYETLINSTAL